MEELYFVLGSAEEDVERGVRVCMTLGRGDEELSDVGEEGVVIDASRVWKKRISIARGRLQGNVRSLG